MDKLYQMITDTIIRDLEKGSPPWRQEQVVPPTMPLDSLLPCWEPAKELIVATGAQIIYGGDYAYYDRNNDRIHVPNQNQYPDQAEFFITTFHELAHWSESRLNWTGDGAMNELIAELVSCRIAVILNLPNRSMANHKAYLPSWLNEMRNDGNWFLKALFQSFEVSDFLLAFRPNS